MPRLGIWHLYEMSLPPHYRDGARVFHYAGPQTEQVVEPPINEDDLDPNGWDDPDED